jgi:aryl-alcohol dehydrogenase-like predicted oxidoreductase
MQYRMLGRTGIRVSVVGLGTMVHAGHFGPMNDSESLSAIDAALALGVNFIDTSDAYGAGYSESLLGKTLRGRRDKVVLATKGGNVMVGPDRGKRKFTADYISGVLEQSLQRLQTDWIDLYQLHNPSVEVIEHGEVWEVLERAKKAGKIRHYGVSINTVDEGLAAAKTGRSDTIQAEYNLLMQEPADTFFPIAQEADIGIIARVPLRRGILTGKMTLEDQKRFQADDVRARGFAGDLFKKELEKTERLRFLVHKPCLAHPAVSVTIAGARNDRQMRENAAAAELSIPPDELQKARDLWRNGFSV